MATDKSFSMGEWLAYCNGRAATLQAGAKIDFKKNYLKMSCPNKDELDGALAETTLDLSHTMQAIPETISGFMATEHRKFDLPAVDKKTAPATIRVDAVPEKVTEGINQLGPNKGKPYKSVTKAHDEVKVKSHNKDFKK